MKRKTQEEFVESLAKRNNKVSIIGEYRGVAHKILTKCNFCGFEWMANTKNLYSGCGCPKCFGTPLKSHEQFVKDVRDINSEIEVVGEYIDAKTSIEFKCLKCGNIWNSTPNNILKKTGCPQCYGTPKKTAEAYKKQFYDNNFSIDLLSDYVNNKTKISVQCKVCSFIWSVIPSDMIRKDNKKTGCPKCAGNQKKTQEEFVYELKNKNPKINVLGKYAGKAKKIKVKCVLCGNIWNADVSTLLRGGGCPDCAKGFQTSFFEYCILLSLRKIYGDENVVHRDKSLIGKEIDIYIPSKKIAFEPGGWFWHKSKLDDDYDKQKQCEQKGVRLLTIYDDVETGIESIDKEGLWLLIHEDIGLQRTNIELISDVLHKVFEMFEIEFDLSEDEIRDIRNKADLEVRKMMLLLTLQHTLLLM